MSSLATLRSIKKIKGGLNFKHADGYYVLTEFKIMQNSGYALFKCGEKEVYFTVINLKGRRSVAAQLTSEILGKMHWTSIIDIGRYGGNK